MKTNISALSLSIILLLLTTSSPLLAETRIGIKTGTSAANHDLTNVDLQLAEWIDRNGISVGTSVEFHLGNGIYARVEPMFVQRGHLYVVSFSGTRTAKN